MITTIDSKPQLDGFQSLLTAASMTGGALHTPMSRSPTSTQSISPTASRKNSTIKRQRSRDPNRTPRDHRPMYTQEEADAILYYRDSVQLPWKKVVDAWNNLFDPITGEKWGPRTISGLQSHYYRMLGFDKGGARRPSAPNPEIGLLKATNRRYWWTYGSDPSVLQTLVGATPEQLKLAAKQNLRRLRREVHKEGRQRKLSRRLTQNESIIKVEVIEPTPMHIDEIAAASDSTSSYGGDADSVSSMTDTFEHHSLSEGDGYETSASCDVPPSSKTSMPPTSPTPLLDCNSPRRLSADCKSNTLTLPSCRQLQKLADSVHRSHGHSHSHIQYKQQLHSAPRRSISYKDERAVEKWREQVENLGRSTYETAPVRPVALNPMSLSSMLSSC